MAEQRFSSDGSVERLYCETAATRLADQLAIVDVQTQRITSVLTIGSVVLPLTAGVLTSEAHQLEYPRGQAVLLTLAVAAYLFLAACFLLAWRFRKWDTRPEMTQWKEVAQPDRLEPELRYWLGTAYVDAYNANSPQLHTKVQWVARGAAALVAEVILLSAAVLLPLIARLW